MTNYDEENSVDATPVGTVYVTGSSVDKGKVDLEKTVQYLKGLEKALKFFIVKTSPEIAQNSYSIEVRIRPGSLVTDIITIGCLVGASVFTVGLGAYVKTAAEQLAKNDVGEKTTRDIAKNALRAMKTVVRLAKHRGSMMTGHIFKPSETKVIDANNIIIINGRGEKLTVTKSELELYRDTPKNEFKDMMSLVDEETQIYIDDKPIDRDSIPDDAVTINFMERSIFDDKDEAIDDNIIFPELIQDSVVTLEGELTRGNGITNTLGFSYCGRILKCIPYGSDSVKSYRDMLFGYVKIRAVVDRRSTTKGSVAILKKPVLRIMKIEKIEENEDNFEQISLI
mgnify:FL=1